MEIRLHFVFTRREQAAIVLILKDFQEISGEAMTKSKSLSYLAAAVFLALIWAAPLFAEICDCAPAIRAQIPEFDSAAHLSDAERSAALRRHLPWGVPDQPPGADNERRLVLQDYVVSYDADLNTPTWVAYRLTDADVDESQPGYVKRADCFRDYPPELLNDPTPPSCDDYEADPYDRGHMVNSKDMCRSATANANSFFLINMAPQHPNFNQKIWRMLEKRVHGLLEKPGYDEIYIITGSVFDHDESGGRDPDAAMIPDHPAGHIAVPSAFYKIIVVQRPNGFLDVLAILLPHTNESITGAARYLYLKRHIVSVDHIEGLTGVNFFPDLEKREPDRAAAIEACRAQGLWW